MQTVSILAFKKMPEIRSKVYSTEIIPLKSKIVFKGDNNSRLFIMLSGSATYSHNGGDSNTKEKSFPSNYILILPAGEELCMTATTNICQLLCITFDLYGSMNLDDILKEDSDPSFNYRKLRLLMDCSSIASYEENFPYFQADVHNLIMHCKLNIMDLKVISFPLENVLYTMLRVQFSATINVLRSVKAFAITSNKYQFQNPFNYSISKISVLSSPKSNKSKSETLCEVGCKHIFMELPTDKSFYEYHLKEDERFPEKEYCDFHQTDGDRFKMWLFPDYTLPSLEDYKNTGVITFKFKANQPGSFLLMLYHTPSYQCITYSFEIKTPDEWTEFEIPISKNSSLNAMLPYIEKAVQYIQDNYAEKITIQDIADHVRIHPSYLSSIFRKSLNQSVNSYINFHRINIAKQLLRNSNTSITDIALQTGFYDAQHFLKTFKKNTGFTPSEYRNID